MPSPVNQNTSPSTHLLRVMPDFSFLHTFGCACWPSLRKYNSRKLEFCSKLCVFFGYSPMHKGYKCLDRTSGCIYISRDVVFDETFFPFAHTGPSPDISKITPPTSFPTHEPATESAQNQNYDLSMLSTNPPGADVPSMQAPAAVDVPSSTTVIAHVGPTNAPHAGLPDTPHIGPLIAPQAGEPHDAPASPRRDGPPSTGVTDSASCSTRSPSQRIAESSSAPTATSSSPASSPAAAHPMTMRLRDGVRQPRIFTDGTIRYDLSRRAFLDRS